VLTSPVALTGRIEILPESASLAGRCTGVRIDDDLAHQPQVDDETFVANTVTGNAVTASAHGDRKIGNSCEPDRRDDVGDIERPDHQCRPRVDHSVESRPRQLKSAVIRSDDRTSMALSQIGYRPHR
jgi:hypothetical protein